MTAGLRTDRWNDISEHNRNPSILLLHHLLEPFSRHRLFVKFRHLFWQTKSDWLKAFFVYKWQRNFYNARCNLFAYVDDDVKLKLIWVYERHRTKLWNEAILLARSLGFLLKLPLIYRQFNFHPNFHIFSIFSEFFRLLFKFFGLKFTLFRPQF